MCGGLHSAVTPRGNAMSVWVACGKPKHVIGGNSNHIAVGRVEYPHADRGRGILQLVWLLLLVSQVGVGLCSMAS